jgi:hypothetical protein
MAAAKELTNWWCEHIKDSTAMVMETEGYEGRFGGI